MLPVHTDVYINHISSAPPAPHPPPSPHLLTLLPKFIRVFLQVQVRTNFLHMKNNSPNDIVPSRLVSSDLNTRSALVISSRELFSVLRT